MKKIIVSFFRKSVVLVTNIVLRKRFIKALGKFNKKEKKWWLYHPISFVLIKTLFFFIELKSKIKIEKNKPIRSLFLVYPANKKYRDNFVFNFHAELMIKHNWLILINFINQNGVISIVFATALPETNFGYRSENYKTGKSKELLEKIHQKVSEIAEIIGVEVITKAGILPSIDKKLGINISLYEAETTVIGVCKSVSLLQKIENLSKDCPLVIFGRKGHVGNSLMEELWEREYSGDVYEIDIDNSDIYKDFYSIELKKISHIIIELSGALIEYVPYFSSNTFVLNECYPEPKAEIVNMVNALGGKVFHIVGRDNCWVMTKFGGAYLDCIPLCASRQEDDDETFQVAIAELIPYLKNGLLKNEFIKKGENKK